MALREVDPALLVGEGLPIINGNALEAEARLSEAAQAAADEAAARQAHEARVDNPHGVTAAQTEFVAGGGIIATNVQAAINELDSEKQPVGSYAPSSHDHDASYASSDAPAINIMPDSGRFAGEINPLSLGLGSAAFTKSPLLDMFTSNNVSVASAGKFTHNNSTNGGTGAALEPTVSDLLAAMGRTGVSARFGPEFFVPEYTMGAGTTTSITFSDRVTRYLATLNGAKTVFGVGDMSTVAMWVRCTSGSIVFQRRPLSGLGGVVEQRLGGQLVADAGGAGGLFLAPSDGWRHVYVLAKTFAGFESNHPFIYAESNSVWQIACPAFYFGRQAPRTHTKPEPTINKLSA